jgi:hypothetical protein
MVLAGGEIAAAPFDEPVTIDFEDAPAGRSGTVVPELTDVYERIGVVFDAPVTALVYDDASIRRSRISRDRVRRW